VSNLVFETRATPGLTSWRQERLIRAGFESELALRIASHPEFDLHALIELVERGCPPEVATRILAPLDHWQAD
jgi:hypothetical protein